MHQPQHMQTLPATGRMAAIQIGAVYSDKKGNLGITRPTLGLQELWGVPGHELVASGTYTPPSAFLTAPSPQHKLPRLQA